MDDASAACGSSSTTCSPRRRVARELARHAARRRGGARLDAESRELLPRGRDREARDVHHPDADRRGRRVQHRVGAGDGGHRQAAPTSRSCARWARRRRSIMAIFVIQGALIGIIGTLIGVVGGILLALNVEHRSCPRSSARSASSSSTRPSTTSASCRRTCSAPTSCTIAVIALAAGAARDALPELARGAGQSRRGAAL